MSAKRFSWRWTSSVARASLPATLPDHRHVRVRIALGAGANAENLEADAVEDIDRIPADSGPLKDDIGLQGQDGFDIRRKSRAMGHVRRDIEHPGKNSRQDSVAHRRRR